LTASSSPSVDISTDTLTLGKGVSGGWKEMPRFGPACTELRMLPTLRLPHMQQVRDFSLQTQGNLQYRTDSGALGKEKQKLPGRLDFLPTEYFTTC